jgi:hypothetical protein
VLFGLAFGSSNPIVSATAAGLLVIVLLWSFVEMRRSPHYDAKTRRGAWWVLLPLAAAMIRVVAFVTGWPTGR